MPTYLYCRDVNALAHLHHGLVKHVPTLIKAESGLNSVLGTFPRPRLSYRHSLTGDGARSSEFAPHAALLQGPGRSDIKLLFGHVLDFWRSGGAGDRFGWPLAHQQHLPGGPSNGGGSYAFFEQGEAIFCGGTTPCVELLQPVVHGWLANNGPQGCLGFPLPRGTKDSDPWLWPFEHGTMMYNPLKGDAPQVRCR